MKLLIHSVETDSLVYDGSEDGLDTSIEIIFKIVMLRPTVLLPSFSDPCNVLFHMCSKF